MKKLREKIAKLIYPEIFKDCDYWLSSTTSGINRFSELRFKLNEMIFSQPKLDNMSEYMKGKINGMEYAYTLLVEILRK